ncbi:MAG: hypothetical protein Q8P34_21065 [Bacteroidota bacterium]|nr:hypothetical protein [Bacteroidota bacterium]
MKRNTQFLGKFIYAVTFLILIPAVLWFWARYTQTIVALPVIKSTIAGMTLIVMGGSLMLWGMFALQFYGNGLPMNAYPPPVFVTKGPLPAFSASNLLGLWLADDWLFHLFGLCKRIVAGFTFDGYGNGCACFGSRVD